MASTAAEREMRFVGLGLSDGIVVARARLLNRQDSHEIPYYNILKSAVDAEKERFLEAQAEAEQQLDALIEEVKERIGPAQANIFVAQKMMASDPVLSEQILGRISREQLNAETVIESVLEEYETRLLEVDDEYLKDRASDIGEVRRRLTDILHKTSPARRYAEPLADPEPDEDDGRPEILVAEELTPSETVNLDSARTLGFVTERGGPASHAAILARALNIPAVSGIPGIRRYLTGGQEVLLNGDSGEVIIWPSKRTLALYPGINRSTIRQPRTVPPLPGIEVMGNISLAREAQTVSQMQGDGVGLYRTEFECFAAGRLLTEEEHYARYREALEALEGRPLHVRLLDFGSDKSAPFLNLPREENPCLGLRGSRLLLRQPQLLAPQARGIARAARYGDISVLYPMIIDLDQFLRLMAIFRQQARSIGGAEVRHGVMFETPSACLAAGDLLQIADFASIGSNDLIQYLFAVDRNNEQVAYDYGPEHELLWKVLAQITEAAHAAGKPLSICGEMAGDPKLVGRLLDLGIRRISVTPRLIGLTRASARRHHSTAANA